MRLKIIIILAAAAVGLRLWHLNSALWYDEAYSAWLARLDLPHLWAATLGDVHPPGYYLLLWAITKLLGYSEIVLRLPSVLAGLALIFVVYRLGAALARPGPAAIAAAVITAFAPFQVYYSQEARCYALLTLLIALSSLWCIHRAYYRAALAMAAGMWLHNMAGLFVAGVLAGAWLAGRKIPLRPGLLLAGLAGPALWFTLRQAGQITGDYWIPPLTSPGRLLATLDDLLWFTPNNPFVIAAGGLTAMGLLWLIFDVRFWLLDAAGRFLAIMAMGPLLAAAAASLIWQPVLISRVMAPAAPFYYLWLARAITARPGRLLAYGPAAGLTAALTLAALVCNARPPVDRSLLAEFEQADAIYHANVGSYVVWQYYLPHKRQYVWPQNTTLGQTLSAPTRLAMGMAEAEFNRVQCSAKNWRLIYFHNPTTTPQEIEYMTNLTQNAVKIRQLRKDNTVDAALYALTPACR